MILATTPVGKVASRFEKSQNPSPKVVSHVAKTQRKKSTPPTIAQSLRNQEKKMQEEYYASLKTANLDLP